MHNGALVLSSYTEDSAPLACEHFRIIPWLCTDDYDYDKLFRVFWNANATLVNVEHDVRVSSDVLNELIDCGHDFCTIPYVLYPVTTGLKEPTSSVSSNGVFSSLGCVKLSMARTKARVLWDSVCWNLVDFAVNNTLKQEIAGFRWHVHTGSVFHDHKGE
jgi:hypothetical protein